MISSKLFAAVRHALLPASLCVSACAVFGAGHETTKDDPSKPIVHEASNEGEVAMGHFKIPAGLKIELWAAEPMVANPVCMRVDNHDRVYLIETFRHTSNTLDIRGHMDWLTDDLACRTVEDRVKLLRRKYGPNIRKMTQDDDRIRLLEDTTGSGLANKATVFASGFNKIESGIAAGLTLFRGNVYLADIPSIYLLRDTTGDGTADVRKELSTGYGVHISFLGHDLHGLCIGPDRKLYFSIGDRGTNAKAIDGSTAYLPDTGGVFRCDLDGKNLEIFATGLRNPQQMCFDDLGNLMTGDNNPDYGDPARWVYVVEGGDSGWRIGYQEARNPRGGGPWMWESLWQTSDKLVDAAYILPPVAHLGSGPSGVAYYPGTGLPEKYDKHFFMVDFRGGSAQSTVHSFALKQKGASYELVDHDTFIKGMLATDIDFSTRGGLYACDWTEGWNKPGKGRIYRVFDPNAANDPIVEETRKLLADGFEQRPNEELVKLLSHRDRRVRQEAQFALADRGAPAIPLFTAVAEKGDNLLARLHAIWALGDIARKIPDTTHPEYRVRAEIAGGSGTIEANTPGTLYPLVALLADPQAEVRAQAAKVLGEHEPFALDAFVGLLKLLADPEPRPKFFAAIALSHFGRSEAIAPLLTMLRANDDQDAHLRHAGVMGLIGCRNVDRVLAAAKDPSPAVRLSVLLTLRRLQRPEIAQFLNDADPHLVSEAAHAINDVPIDAAMPQLAAMIERPNLPDTVLLRAVNAAYRVGTPEMARALAAFAGKEDGAAMIRIEALNDLGNWAEPSPLDRVMNMYRPLPNRDETPAREAATRAIEQILHPNGDSAKTPVTVRKAAVNLIQKLHINDTAVLFDIVTGVQFAADLRAEALSALAERNDPKLLDAVNIGLSNKAPRLREQAIRSLAKLPDATPKLAQYLESRSIGEQQAALAGLADVPDKSAEEVLSKSFDQLLENQWKPELQLDLMDAARKRNAPELTAKIEKYQKSLPEVVTAHFRECQSGGNAERGKAVFERSDASCVRCHTIRKQGGTVGPALDGIGLRQTRDYLVESIVAPDAKIAPGYETAVIKLKNGKTYTGIVKKEMPSELDLMNADGAMIKLDPAEIQSRTRGVSAMPEGFGQTLSKHDIRDLVEYLAELKK